MTIWKKALSVGTSAALLASLLVTAVAPAALASTTVTGVGTVPQGGTSTTSATFLFTESSKTALTNSGGSFRVYIFDKTAVCTAAPAGQDAELAANQLSSATVHFTGTATQSGPGSLDLAALVVGDNYFIVTTRSADNNNIEPITISGLSIKADTTAPTGAVKACVYADTGIFAAAFATGTATATGKLVGATGVGATAFEIALDVGSCEFTSLPASLPTLPDATVLGPIKIGTDSVTTATVGALGAPVPGQHNVTAAAPALAATHGANDVVTEKVANCTARALGSPGTVGASLRYRAPASQTRVNPGETNQKVTSLVANERDSTTGTGSNDGPAWTKSFFTSGGTLTLTITTPGVTFSSAPLATATSASATPPPIHTTGTSGLLFVGAPTASASVFGTLSADRQSVKWTVDTKSTSAAWITWSEIYYDVASTVATGTAINVTLAASDGAVAPTSRSNAVVGRVLTVTATAPTVYIGENNQTAGLVTIAETAADFFTGGAGSNNTFAICLNTGEQFASAPYAKVTAGDLKLRDGAAVSTTSIVQGLPKAVFGIPFACYYWTVWTASTVASTVVIGGDAAVTTGVKINVPAGMTIGPVDAGIRTGDVVALDTALESRVTIANRVFRNQVVVTALSQPFIPVGSNGSPAGDIQIQETANGQLKTGERICVELVPNQNASNILDAFMKGVNTADVPVATASNGIVVGSVSFNNAGVRCNGKPTPTPTPMPNVVASPTTPLVMAFNFLIQQQSITGSGKVVISNIKYATVNDAVVGPVQVNVFGFGGDNTQIDFQTLISNARIGSKATLSIGAVSALGVPPNQGPASTSTKVAAANKFITWRFAGGAALAGKTVRVYVSTRNAAGGYGPFVNLTGRVADANGNAFFSWRATKTWVSVRAYFAGDATYLASWSAPTQGRWL